MPRPAIRTVILATLLGASGCGLLLDPHDDDAGSRDGGRPRVDASLRGPPACGEPPDEAVVAWYRMESLPEGRLDDATERHEGSFPAGAPDAADGPAGCGQAMRTGSPHFGAVAHDASFDLREGAVDLWVRAPLDPPLACRGLVSRDAINQRSGGHFTVWLNGSGGVTVRLQDRDDGERFISSDGPLPAGSWAHLGVNFGPPGLELWVNGALQSGVAAVDPCDGGLALECEACQLGIQGNQEPWVMGASGSSSGDRSFDPPIDFFDGAIDEVRISDRRRDFSALATP